MKQIIQSLEELRNQFEMLFKRYEVAGTEGVSFEELQNIFSQLKETKFKLMMISGE